jgi:DNA-binding beta-propeller fold protein YncE
MIFGRHRRTGKAFGCLAAGCLAVLGLQACVPRLPPVHHSSPPKTSPPAHHPSPPKVSPPPASTSLLLGLPSFHKIVVDDAHQHVFVSGGTNSPSEQTKPTVLVATSTGTVVKRFTGLPSAWGMALSSATHQLFVALPAIGKVAVIDTATLTVTRMLAAPADAAPTNLTIAGGLLWISSPEVLSEPDRGRELLTVDPADLDAGIQWADPLGGFDWVLGAPFLASPATGNLLAVATESNSTSSSVRLYRVNRTALTPVGREFLLQAEADDLAFTPDGRYLTMVRRGGPMYRFSIADPPPNWDLIMAGEYNFWGPAQPPPSSRGCDAGGHETLAGVYTADGKTFIGGPSASFYPADSGHPTTTSDLPGCQLPHGLAVDASASRVFSVATSAQGLRLVTVPGPDSSAVSHLPALPLGLQTAYAAVVDPVNRHIFVSPGELGNEIAVLDFSGHLLKLIPNMYGAQQLALSPRLGKLYAALSTGNGVAEIDTRTLTETRRFTAGIRTQQVLLSGGRLWARVRIGNDLSARQPGSQPAGSELGRRRPDADVVPLGVVR